MLINIIISHIFTVYSGDHFYKQNKKLPLESQMISAMPDIRVEELKTEDSFLVLACDGIWYERDFNGLLV